MKPPPPPQGPETPKMPRLNRVKDELSVCNGVVPREDRIALPKTLRNTAVDLAHVGHQGVVKTKSLICEKIWFLGIDKMVEDKVKNCLPYQAATHGKVKLPAHESPRMTPLPNAPWKKNSMDFAGPFPSGDYLVVVTNACNYFPEVEIVTSTSTRATIPKLDAIFARQGIPEVLKSNNGLPFNSHE